MDNKTYKDKEGNTHIEYDTYDSDGNLNTPPEIDTGTKEITQREKDADDEKYKQELRDNLAEWKKENPRTWRKENPQQWRLENPEEWKKEIAERADKTDDIDSTIWDYIDDQKAESIAAAIPKKEGFFNKMKDELKRDLGPSGLDKDADFSNMKWSVIKPGTEPDAMSSAQPKEEGYNMPKGKWDDVRTLVSKMRGK